MERSTISPYNSSTVLTFVVGTLGSVSTLLQYCAKLTLNTLVIKEVVTSLSINVTSLSILEKLILNRLREYLYTSGYQFGFKSSSSTEDCIFSTKEIISYYRSPNTSIFACFIDIKSVYDKVSYNKHLCNLN